MRTANDQYSWKEEAAGTEIDERLARQQTSWEHQ